MTVTSAHGVLLDADAADYTLRALRLLVGTLPKVPITAWCSSCADLDVDPCTAPSTVTEPQGGACVFRSSSVMNANNLGFG